MAPCRYHLCIWCGEWIRMRLGRLGSGRLPGRIPFDPSCSDWKTKIRNPFLPLLSFLDFPHASASWLMSSESQWRWKMRGESRWRNTPRPPPLGVQKANKIRYFAVAAWAMGSMSQKAKKNKQLSMQGRKNIYIARKSTREGERRLL